MLVVCMFIFGDLNGKALDNICFVLRKKNSYFHSSLHCCNIISLIMSRTTMFYQAKFWEIFTHHRAHNGRSISQNITSLIILNACRALIDIDYFSRLPKFLKIFCTIRINDNTQFWNSSSNDSATSSRYLVSGIKPFSRRMNKKSL